MAIIISIDLGTSKLCALALCLETREPIATHALANRTGVKGLPAGNDEQDPTQTWQAVGELLRRMRADARVPWSEVVGISLTGQMHGVLLIDDALCPLTNLITWRDRRVLGADAVGSLASARERLVGLGPERTGCHLHSGYGAATLYHLSSRCEIPQGAEALSIADYIAAMLTGNVATDPTHAASWGLLDLERTAWDMSRVERLGLRAGLLPTIRASSSVLGTLRSEVAREIDLPSATVVHSPVGDNQASVIGVTGLDRKAAVVNLGTGGQVSIPHQSAVWVEGFETRPMPSGGFILVGASLCGGWAYAYLRRFFQDAVRQFAEVELSDGDVYRRMNELALQSPTGCGGLRADTRFHGTRRDPDRRGTISGIDAANLTPAHLARAFSEGMVAELAEMFHAVDHRDVTRIIACGNAVRENPLVLETIEGLFGLGCRGSAHQEEAALGAAHSAAVSANLTTAHTTPGRSSS